MVITMEETTIAAIATGAGGGLGVVRLSGPRALAVAEAIFVPENPDKQVACLSGYSCTLGRIVDGTDVVDQALLLLFRGPKSYTGEDMAEFSCHGGRVVLETVLALAIRHGAVPAPRGEFTKRAFLAGKLTLTQAESVADIISAQSAQGLRAAQSIREGALHRAVAGVCDSLTGLAAHIAAWVDYPEEDVEALEPRHLRGRLTAAKDALDKLAATYGQGRMIREGISTAIVGSANVGKSTLMNLLAGYDRSIVTDIPGTTRDVVEERVQVEDLTLTLWDTAGLRETQDQVEQIGVARSRERLDQCDLILAVFDNSKELSEEDSKLLRRLDGRLAVGIINKTDLPTKIRREELSRHTKELVEISALEGTGIGELKDAIRRVAGLEDLDPSACLVANARQLSCVRAAADGLEEALGGLAEGATLDGVSVCIQEALEQLMILTGQRATEEIINRVFEQFCVGK